MPDFRLEVARNQSHKPLTLLVSKERNLIKNMKVEQLFNEKEWPEVRRRKAMLKNRAEQFLIVAKALCDKHGSLGAKILEKAVQKPLREITWLPGNLLREIYDILGEEEANKLVEDVYGQLATKNVGKNLEQMGIKGNDCIALAKVYVTPALATNSDIEVVKLEPKCLEVHFLKCETWDTRKHEIPSGFCHSGSNYERTLAKIINPDMTYELRELIPKGDPYCNVIFRLP